MRKLSRILMMTLVTMLCTSLTSCDWIFGDVDTPVIQEPTIKATDLLASTNTNGATTIFWYRYEGELYYAAFKKVGDEYVYQEGGNCNKATTRSSDAEAQLMAELLNLNGDGVIKDLAFGVYSTDDAGNKIDPILLDKITTSTAEVEQKTSAPDNYMVAIGAIFQNASIKKTVDEVREVFNGDKKYQPDIKDTENVLILTLDENNDKPRLKPLEELMKNAAELGISPEKFIGAELDNLKQKVAEGFANGTSKILKESYGEVEDYNRNDAITRALDAQGKKTFAVGEKIAIIYQNTSGETQYAESEALTADDITDNGKKVKINVTLENPKPNGQLRCIYPAAMAKSDIAPIDEINDENTISTERLLTDQDGTLEMLASKFDLAIYDGTITDGAFLPSTIALKNQLAIVEFTIKDGDNDITSTITKLDIQQGTQNYTVFRPATDSPAEGPIYVAMLPSSGSDEQNFTLTATDSNGIKYKQNFKFTLAANNMYPLTVNTLKVVE